MIHRIKHILITAAVLTVFAASSIASEGVTRLEALKSMLAKKGYDAEALFSRPEFEVYEDIDTFFKKSAENEGIRPVNKARREQGADAAARVFEDELTKYKERTGFEWKQREIPGFITANITALEAAEREYDIPKELISAVIGIESLFGKITGKHLAFNVYVSMYIRNYRGSFALSQLEELLKFSKKKDIDVYTFNSSYAGAIGAMQFLPWSLNRWFVGTDVKSMNDSITSVANYLAHFRKERGSIEKAVYAYNPSRLYVQTVLDLAEYAKHAGNNAAAGSE